MTYRFKRISQAAGLLLLGLVLGLGVASSSFDGSTDDWFLDPRPFSRDVYKLGLEEKNGTQWEYWLDIVGRNCPTSRDYSGRKIAEGDSWGCTQRIIRRKLDDHLREEVVIPDLEEALDLSFDRHTVLGVVGYRDGSIALLGITSYGYLPLVPHYGFDLRTEEFVFFDSTRNFACPEGHALLPSRHDVSYIVCSDHPPEDELARTLYLIDLDKDITSPIVKLPKNETLSQFNVSGHGSTKGAYVSNVPNENILVYGVYDADSGNDFGELDLIEVRHLAVE